MRKRNASGNAECDICEQVEYLEEHHIEGRKVTNPNNPSNVCNICSNCHTKVHRGKIIIEKWARSTSGLELFWHYKGEEGSFDDSDTHLI